ncbi:hypothetical protein N8D56_05780 [Devosia sp. A8/3-2]|nr:hypothetical protein N8D56_05780 [Devosia sp. A8/3-2]
MSETPSDYIRTHRLVAKYGIGLLVLALAGVGGVLNGDQPSLIAFKVMAAIPVVIAWICLPQLYNPVRSRTPFTPSFIERTGLEAVILAIAIVLSSWTIDHQPLRSVLTALVGAVFYFGALSLIYGFIARRR